MGTRISGVTLQLKLPNLVPRRTRFQIFGDEVFITPRVENAGNAQSDSFNVRVVIKLIDNNGQEHPAQDLGDNSWQPLYAGQDHTHGHTPGISVAGLPRPVTLIMLVAVDTPTATGGQVWESNEADNIRTDETTIF